MNSPHASTMSKQFAAHRIARGEAGAVGFGNGKAVNNSGLVKGPPSFLGDRVGDQLRLFGRSNPDHDILRIEPPKRMRHQFTTLPDIPDDSEV